MSSVNFENNAVAFQHKNNSQLKHSFWLFKLIASPFLVKVGGALTNLAVGLGIPYGWANKKNIFGVCALFAPAREMAEIDRENEVFQV